MATTIGAVLFIQLIGPGKGPTVSATVLTVVILIFGEVTPKSLAKERPEAWAIVATPLLRVMAVLLTPVNFLFTQWKKLLRVLLRHQDDDGITEEELMGMVDQAETEGSLDQHESDLIRNAIEFNDMEVSEILTPRVDLEALADTATMEEAAAMYASWQTTSVNSRISVGAVRLRIPPVVILVAISYPNGSIHFSGNADAPPIIPKIAPSVAAVQSVSHPQFTALQIASPKSSPYSHPIV